MPERVVLTARDPNGVEPDVEIVFMKPDPDTRPPTIRDKEAVRDVEIIQPDGTRTRSWTGTTKELDAMAAANPLTAFLFTVADLVFVEKAELEAVGVFVPEDADGLWTWISKADGKFILQGVHQSV